MRTIQITRRFTRASWGGTETVVLQTSRALQAFGHPTEIYTTKALDAQPLESISGIDVHRFNYFYPWFGLNDAAKQSLDDTAGNLFSWSLMRQLRKTERPDVMHLHTGKRLGGIVRHVCQSRKIPYVVSIHGGMLDVGGGEASRWVEPTEGHIEWGKALGWWVGSRKVMEEAAAILCVGKEEARRMAEAYPGVRVEHLPNGVDSAHFADGDGAKIRNKFKIPEQRFLMLQVGRIDPQKNQHVMLQRLRSLLDEGVDAHLMIVGHPTHEEYHAKIKAQLAADSQLAAHVTLVEGMDPESGDLQNAYHAADVFVLPSIHEPFGVVALEAWAAGKAVVASRVGGIPDFIEDGNDGFLLPVDQDADWVRCLRGLADNSDLRQTLAQAGEKKAVLEYDWSAVSKKLLTIYQEVAA